MEVYILNDSFQRDTVVDRFESCIWTERYSAFGDFQLVMHSTIQSRSLLQKGLRLAMNKSRRVMQIENVEDKDDSEGRSLLTVSGRSLESIMTKRSTRSATILSGGAITESWESVGTPGAIARNLFDRFFRTNPDIVADRIPFIQSPTTTLYPADTILEPTDSITAVIQNSQVYDRIKEICDAYGLGFRLYRGPDNLKLYFNVYAGSDRTSTQVTLPAVIFSPDLENLSNTSEFSSIEEEMNIAYVYGKDKTVVVYGAGVDPSISGFDRKVLTVQATDIVGTTSTAIAALEQKGREELSKYKPLQALDGELPQTSRYVYDVDYSLGDLIELRNDEGSTQRMRVTEQIFVDDAQGERSYPTLAADVFITAGSWSAWDANGVWDTAVGTWDEQPV